DLAQVVVVAGNPVDRDDRASPAALEHERQCPSGERLADGVGRARKEARLLPGGNRKRPGGTQPGQLRLLGRRIDARWLEGHIPARLAARRSGDGRRERRIEDRETHLWYGSPRRMVHARYHCSSTITRTSS